MNQSVWDENDVAIFFGLSGTSKLSSPSFMRQVFRPILFGIIFAMQNSTVVQVRFLIWSVQMSQALVIFLTGAVGTIIGFLFSTAFKISRQS